MTPRMTHNQCLSDHKQAGVKGKNTRLMYAFTSNTNGSEKLQPFIIGKAAQPQAFKEKTGEQLGFYYQNNAKAWMTTYFYQEWIEQWDCEHQAKGHQILLLQDNFSGHVPPNNLQNIQVKNFKPNLTAHIQLKDQGIICCFKAHYHAKFIQQVINWYNEGITPAEISYRRCVLQTSLGVRSTRQQSETAGAKQEFYLTLIASLHSQSP
jgi:hypothetical protein